jgi:hypothetical protein
MAVRFQITFDAGDAPRLAAFWQEVLGYVQEPPPPGHDSWQAWAEAMGIPEEHWDDARACVDPDGVGPRLFLQKVPEGKSAKNRVHLDVDVGGGREVPIDERRRRVDARVEELVALGAIRQQAFHHPNRDEYFVVMADPEGNEFCLQ